MLRRIDSGLFMPNRIIREGWIESCRIDELDAASERFFLRLCLKADDFGRFHAMPQLLKSMLFPIKEDIRNTDMTRCLAACEKAGLVRCYEVTGKRYLEINNFDQRLRSKVGRFPDMSGIRPTNDRHMTVTCRLEGEGEGKVKGSRREVEEEVEVEGTHSELPETMEEICAQFPDIDVWNEYQKLKARCAKKGEGKPSIGSLIAWLKKATPTAAIKKPTTTKNQEPNEEPISLKQQSEYVAELARLKSRFSKNGSESEENENDRRRLLESQARQINDRT